MEICKQQSEIDMRPLPAISIYGYVGGRLIKALWALEWAFFWINRGRQSSRRIFA